MYWKVKLLTAALPEKKKNKFLFENLVCSRKFSHKKLYAEQILLEDSQKYLLNSRSGNKPSLQNLHIGNVKRNYSARQRSCVVYYHASEPENSMTEEHVIFCVITE
jgi:hypothetical protein